MKPVSNQGLSIAFYAPLKAPDDPVPSGDRTMARLIVKALQQAGHRMCIASRLRSFSTDPGSGALRDTEARAAAEIETLITRAVDLQSPLARPDLWLSYHPYYKAPDLIGPTLSRHWSIPYVTIEASHAGKRSTGEWGTWQAHVEHALSVAALNIAMTPRDRSGITGFLGHEHSIADLAPFIDVGTPRSSRPLVANPVKLITVAMMRPGDKLASYRFLAAALAPIIDMPWTLDIIGDGKAREAVRVAFSGFPDGKILWRGEYAQEHVRDALGSADIYLWPGFGEAYGLAYLEAQAAGLPVVALDVAGVASVVIDDISGALVETHALEEIMLDRYRSAIVALIGDSYLRRRLGRSAERFVRSERSLTMASRRLDALLTSVVDRNRLSSAKAVSAHG